MWSIFFGYAAGALQALHSRKSGQHLFSKQHLIASTALAPAFDQWRPACQYDRFNSAFRPLAACCRVAESSAESDNPRSKRRIPEVESATAPRDP